MPTSKIHQYPYSEGWIHAKFTFKKGETMTEEEMKKSLLLGDNEADYEFAMCKPGKVTGRVIFRKKPQQTAA